MGPPAGEPGGSAHPLRPAAALLSPLPTRLTRDTRIVISLVNSAVLVFLGAALGGMSVLLLAIHGGPALTSGLGVLALFGYLGLFFSMVLILRSPSPSPATTPDDSERTRS